MHSWRRCPAYLTAVLTHAVSKSGTLIASLSCLCDHVTSLLHHIGTRPDPSRFLCRGAVCETNANCVAVYRELLYHKKEFRSLHKRFQPLVNGVFTHQTCVPKSLEHKTTLQLLVLIGELMVETNLEVL